MSVTTPPIDEPQSRIVPSRWMRALVRPTGGRPALLVEFLIFWMFFQYFSFAQEHIRGGREESIHHAHKLFEIEQALHLDIERTLNHGLAQFPVFARAAGYYYGMVLATVPMALAWVWWKNPHGFRSLRRLLVATTLPSLLIFWLLPMAPPRFAVPGTIDINAVYDILGGRLARDPSKSANLYAAMPSLHIGWSSWVGYALFDTYRRRRPRLAWFWALYPLFTAWNVMATGNHFILDVFGGAALLLFGMMWVRLLRGAEDRIWLSPRHDPPAPDVSLDALLDDDLDPDNLDPGADDSSQSPPSKAAGRQPADTA